MHKALISNAVAKEERLRQYAEIILAVVRTEASLTTSQAGATVLAGSEVEPHTLITTQYDQ